MSEKKKRSFAFRFSIRFLFVLVTLFSILFGLWAICIQPINRQWHAAETLLEDESIDFKITQTEPVKLPSWMLPILKEGRRQNIVAASCSSAVKKTELLKNLVFLRDLSLGGRPGIFSESGTSKSKWEPSSTTAEFENQIKSVSKLPRLRSVKLFCDRSDWWRSTKFFSPEVEVTVASDAFTIRSGEFPQFMKLLQNNRLEPRAGWVRFRLRNFQIEVENASDEDLALLESVLEHDFTEKPANPNSPPNPSWEVRLSLDPQQVSKGAIDFLVNGNDAMTAKEKRLNRLVPILEFFPANYQFDNTLSYQFNWRANYTSLSRPLGKVPSFDLGTWEHVAPVLDKTYRVRIRNWAPNSKTEHPFSSMSLSQPKGHYRRDNGISIIGDSSALGPAFKRLENVKEVKLNFSGNETWGGDDSFNSYLKTLSSLPSLKRLDLSVYQIDLSTEHAESLSRLGSLESLSFQTDVSIPSNFFQPIAANCSYLKTLSVIGRGSFDIEKSLRCFVDRPAINEISISVSNTVFKWRTGEESLVQKLDRVLRTE